MSKKMLRIFCAQKQYINLIQYISASLVCRQPCRWLEQSEGTKLGKYFAGTLSAILNRAGKSITGYLARPVAPDYRG